MRKRNKTESLVSSPWVYLVSFVIPRHPFLFFVFDSCSLSWIQVHLHCMDDRESGRECLDDGTEDTMRATWDAWTLNALTEQRWWWNLGLKQSFKLILHSLTSKPLESRERITLLWLFLCTVKLSSNERKILIEFKSKSLKSSWLFFLPKQTLSLSSSISLRPSMLLSLSFCVSSFSGYFNKIVTFSSFTFFSLLHRQESVESESPVRKDPEREEESSLSGRENPSLESKAKTTTKKMRRKRSLWFLTLCFFDVLLLKLHNPFLFLSLLQVHFSFLPEAEEDEDGHKMFIEPSIFSLLLLRRVNNICLK